MSALSSHTVAVDTDVLGMRWAVNDLDELAALIAIIALGQASHASRIINELEPREPALIDRELFAGARGQLLITGDTEAKQDVSRYHRDGFLFECISWIAARQTAGDRTYMKDPHIAATTQGLDGLMIEMHASEQKVVRTTIFEDKCTNEPRKKFQGEVLPTFTEHHENKRSRDLVANAVSLIRESGLNGTEATRAASRVLDKRYRTYRAALTVDTTFNSPAARKKLFKGYSDLTDMEQMQRIGAILPIDAPLRDWFQTLAERIITKLREFEAGNV